jgi:hypothetical protein
LLATDDSLELTDGLVETFRLGIVTCAAPQVQASLASGGMSSYVIN